MPDIILQIKDETASGKIINSLDITFATEMVTVKEIIEKRVRAEVKLYNTKLPAYFQGLVQPATAETTLNGFKLKEKRKVDAEKQVYTALDAFQKNGYFVLIDNIQATELEQMVLINSSTSISFLKLTPLVGG